MEAEKVEEKVVGVEMIGADVGESGVGIYMVGGVVVEMVEEKVSEVEMVGDLVI